MPLAVPLLLLDADLQKCFTSTGTLLKAFLIGSIGTFLGTIVAYALGKCAILTGVTICNWFPQNVYESFMFYISTDEKHCRLS